MRNTYTDTETKMLIKNAEMLTDLLTDLSSGLFEIIRKGIGIAVFCPLGNMGIYPVHCSPVGPAADLHSHLRRHF